MIELLVIFIPSVVFLTIQYETMVGIMLLFHLEQSKSEPSFGSNRRQHLVHESCVK